MVGEENPGTGELQERVDAIKGAVLYSRTTVEPYWAAIRD